MIFQNTWKEVVTKRKTQTRRLYQSHWQLIRRDRNTVRLVGLNGRLIYEVGRTYSVQPGRGKKSVGRIEIINMWNVRDVRYIAPHELIAERFESRDDFMRLWCEMHAPEFIDKWRYINYFQPSALVQRDISRFKALAIEFKLVEVY